MPTERRSLSALCGGQAAKGDGSDKRSGHVGAVKANTRSGAVNQRQSVIYLARRYQSINSESAGGALAVNVTPSICTPG
ncbi:MAG: hypothetical protein H7Z16_16795 [Pyrinomonadaceae bacterium]|nr:hypothetical protein [Pyrinomonadaceae bacterium]